MCSKAAAVLVLALVLGAGQTVTGALAVEHFGGAVTGSHTGHSPFGHHGRKHPCLPRSQSIDDTKALGLTGSLIEVKNRVARMRQASGGPPSFSQSRLVQVEPRCFSNWARGFAVFAEAPRPAVMKSARQLTGRTHRVQCGQFAAC
jgi:hypothetical protein